MSEIAEIVRREWIKAEPGYLLFFWIIPFACLAIILTPFFIGIGFLIGTWRDAVKRGIFLSEL